MVMIMMILLSYTVVPELVDVTGGRAPPPAVTALTLNSGSAITPGVRSPEVFS
jgi:hypothetical protein